MIGRIITLAILGILVFSSCIETINNYTMLPPGMWRGYLVLEEERFIVNEDDEEAQTGIEKLNDKRLPFNFETAYTPEGKLELTFINGSERIKINNIQYATDKSLARDSFRIHFDSYNSYIKGYIQQDKIEGNFVKKDKKNYSIPFRAQFGKNYRFTPLKKKPLADLTGKWECTFHQGTEDEYKALGELKQTGNKLEGTFLTETGDYRFLEGTVQDNKAYLSVFDGTHAFLFTMKIMDQDNIVGSFRSGTHYQSSWVGVRNNDFQLRDPNSLTYVKDKDAVFDFTLEGLDGKLVSLKDLKKPVKIFTTMGTWCPNCLDELRFLKEIQKEFGDQVDMLGIAFERVRSKEENVKRLKRYKEVNGINIPIVMGGEASKKVASELFPQVNKIISFPTLFIVDKENKAQYIHTGFSGPATSKYAPFKKEFRKKLKDIIAAQK